jgi:hypothetical protein
MSMYLDRRGKDLTRRVIERRLDEHEAMTCKGRALPIHEARLYEMSTIGILRKVKHAYVRLQRGS